MAQVYDHVLTNWHGARVGTTVVDGERWAWKSRGRREALGYHLASGLLNVPEVRLQPQPDGPPIALVRLAENYALADLPIGDLDEAVAAEMAFSLWIRRRDTHAYNRAYVDGIPMFFDHGSAFAVARDLEHFLREGPDTGFVPAWRVEAWAYEPTTLGTRWLNGATGLAVHPVRDTERFLDAFETWVGRLVAYPGSKIDAALRAAGVRNRRLAALSRFLLRSQRELPEAARRVAPLLVAPTVDVSRRRRRPLR